MQIYLELMIPDCYMGYDAELLSLGVTVFFLVKRGISIAIDIVQPFCKCAQKTRDKYHDCRDLPRVFLSLILYDFCPASYSITIFRQTSGLFVMIASTPISRHSFM